VAGALLDGLSAREFCVAKSIGEREVQAADQQESKLGLTQLLKELCVPAFGDIDLIGILRLCADTVSSTVGWQLSIVGERPLSGIERMQQKVGPSARTGPQLG
jgi:hypothetical protein